MAEAAACALPSTAPRLPAPAAARTRRPNAAAAAAAPPSAAQACRGTRSSLRASGSCLPRPVRDRPPSRRVRAGAVRSGCVLFSACGWPRRPVSVQPAADQACAPGLPPASDSRTCIPARRRPAAQEAVEAGEAFSVAVSLHSIYSRTPRPATIDFRCGPAGRREGGLGRRPRRLCTACTQQRLPAHLPAPPAH